MGKWHTLLFPRAFLMRTAQNNVCITLPASLSPRQAESEGRAADLEAAKRDLRREEEKSADLKAELAHRLEQGNDLQARRNTYLLAFL